MAIELPAAQKVYTTTYDNFKGVDFTNDSTNVWRRRSPTGTNMLPDASGRPFKRNGWYVLLSKEDICDAFSAFSYVAMQDYTQVEITADEFEVDKQRYYTESGGVYTQCDEESQYDDNETYYILTFSEDIFNESKSDYYTESGGTYTQCDDESVYDANETYYKRVYADMTINKCAYFEIAGEDHIVIFTTIGVLFYKNGENGEGEITATNTDEDCYTGYDRCFFFEGNGTSAFYIYGNFKVWRYESDFALHNVTSQITIPTVLAGASADCTGTTIQGYNMLGKKASVEYNDMTLYTWWCSDNLSVDASTYKTTITKNAHEYWSWTWNGSSWVWSGEGTSVSFDSTNIKVTGTKATNNRIIILYCDGVLLPNSVAQADVSDVEVYVSSKTQFDYPLTVYYETEASTLSTGQCSLWSDPVSRAKQTAWIRFKNTYSALAGGEDFIKVIFPSITVTTTVMSNKTDGYNVSATVVGV